MAKFLGNVKIKIDGQLVKTVPDSVEVDFGGYARADQMADDTFNYNAKPIASMLEFEGLVTTDTSISALNDLEQGTVEVITDLPGITYKMTNATRMGDAIKVSSSSGRFRMQVKGDPIVPPS